MARTSVDADKWATEMCRKRHAADDAGESSVKYVKEEILNDSHILELSRRIGDAEELWDLGVNVLGLPEHEIRSAQTKFHPDINQTAHHLLSTWLRQQINRQEAYTALLSALRGCQGMQNLAGRLKQWVERSGGAVGPVLGERLEKIQLLTKQSLRTKPFCLAVGKDWTLRPNQTDLREIFTDLRWTKKHRKAYTVEQEDLKNITQILNEEQLGEDGPVRILVQAGGGMGKSTAMKHLAISWADGTSEELKKFHFVFHISLKHVKDNSPIESIIIAQHIGLKANDVKPEELHFILSGKSQSKILLLIDGHDEYKSGTNDNIDEAIMKQKLWNCWMILTSRETKQLGDIKKYMDAEAEIRGFDSKNVKTYVSRSLGSEMKAKELLKQAVDRSIDISKGIMTIPILLHMICVLFMCNLSLPKTKTGIIQAIVNRCVDREAIRAKGQKAVDTANQALYNLGKLAWQGLNEAGKKLYFDKEEVIRVAGEEALQLGLLFGTENLTPQEEEIDVLCFPHLLIQEFVAGYFLSKLDMTTLQKMLPDMATIWQHREVVKFACCLSDQPDVLIEIFCDRLVNQAVLYSKNVFSWKEMFHADYNFLKELRTEITNSNLTVDPLRNRFVNYFGNEEDEDEEPITKLSIFVPSKVFIGLGEDRQSALLFADNESETLSIESASDVKIVEHDSLRETNRSDNKDVLRPTTSNDDDIKGERHQHNEKLSERKARDGAVVEGYLMHTFHLRSQRYGMDAALNMLGEIRERVPVCVTKIDMPCLQLKENSGPDDERYFACKIDISDFEELVPAIELMKEISAYQNIGIHHLYMKDMDFCFGRKTERIVTELLRMPSFNHARSVIVQHCDLTTMIWRQLNQQLHHLTNLEKLDLRNTTRKLTQEVVQILKSSLQRCRQIAILKLSYNSLENCLATFPGSVFDTGFPNLKKLILKQTQLSTYDVQSVFQAIANSSFPKLKELNLSGNALTDSVRHLMMDAGSGLMLLELLDLENTELNKSDLSALATLAKLKHLPKLRTLILNNNVLTDDLSDLFGDSDHPGFTNLEELMINDIELSSQDLNTLTNVVKAGKLPKLDYVFLAEDDITQMENEMDEFETACEENKTVCVSGSSQQL